MIDKTLILLRNRLNEHLGSDPDESPEDKVVFVDGEQTDPLTFKLGAITVLLINIDEENVLRAPDRHARVSSDGVRQKVDPDIRVNLHVLFVARFKEYEESLRHLTLIIRYFQSHRVFNHENTPELVPDSPFNHHAGLRKPKGPCKKPDMDLKANKMRPILRGDVVHESVSTRKKAGSFPANNPPKGQPVAGDDGKILRKGFGRS